MLTFLRFLFRDARLLSSAVSFSSPRRLVVPTS
jgi:hypothetical protein